MKISLPNASDAIPFEEMFSEIKDQKVSINILTLMALVSDLHYLWGICEGMEVEGKTKCPHVDLSKFLENLDPDQGRIKINQ